MRQDELWATLPFLLAAFLMLAACYIIRALREGLVLVDFGADTRSMAVGEVTLILTVASKFRAMANGTWDEDAGKRQFPPILIGANLGALAGAETPVQSHYRSANRGVKRRITSRFQYCYTFLHST